MDDQRLGWTRVKRLVHLPHAFCSEFPSLGTPSAVETCSNTADTPRCQQSPPFSVGVGQANYSTTSRTKDSNHSLINDTFPLSGRSKFVIRGGSPSGSKQEARGEEVLRKALSRKRDAWGSLGLPGPGVRRSRAAQEPEPGAPGRFRAPCTTGVGPPLGPSQSPTEAAPRSRSRAVSTAPKLRTPLARPRRAPRVSTPALRLGRSGHRGP